MRTFQGKFSLDVLVGNGPEQDVGRPRIILLHGMRGATQRTWNPQKAVTPWYAELAKQHNCVVYSLTYDATFVRSRKRDSDAILEELALDLIDFIINRNLLANSTVFVAYSYGGLLLKQALCDSFMMDRDFYFGRRRHQLRTIILLGVPHAGSRLANFLRLIPGSTIAAKDLTVNSRTIKALSRRFQRYWERASHALVSVFETRRSDFGCLGVNIPLVRDIPVAVFVSRESALSGLPREIPVEAACDHIRIATFDYAGSEKTLAALSAAIKAAELIASGNPLLLG